MIWAALSTDQPARIRLFHTRRAAAKFAAAAEKIQGVPWHVLRASDARRDRDLAAVWPRN